VADLSINGVNLQLMQHYKRPKYQQAVRCWRRASVNYYSRQSLLWDACVDTGSIWLPWDNARRAVCTTCCGYAVLRLAFSNFSVVIGE